MAGYLADIAAQRRWTTGLSDPTFGPLTALIVIVPMLLGVSRVYGATMRAAFQLTASPQLTPEAPDVETTVS